MIATTKLRLGGRRRDRAEHADCVDFTVRVDFIVRVYQAMSSFAVVTPLGLMAVAIGAVVGAWARWWLSLAFNAEHPSLPIGTLLANVIGGLLIGMALAWFGRNSQIDPAWRLIVVTGFLGALTTFSSFSAESLLLIQKGEIGWALLHSMAHLFGSLLAAALGYRLLVS